MLPPSPTSTLFPYTTLFRSRKSQPPGSCRSNHKAGAAPGRRRKSGWLGIRPCPRPEAPNRRVWCRSEEHTSELQSLRHLVCRLLLEKKKKDKQYAHTCSTNV